LMAGDPAIRWQTMRDLLGCSPGEWGAEKEKVATEGWGAQFLSFQNSDGSWPNARWTGAVWTMSLLVDLGMPADDERFARAFDSIVCRLMPRGQAVSTRTLLSEMDQCHLGFWLRFGAHFCPQDDRLPQIAEAIFSAQFEDGGWNCRIRTKPKTSHSSFHTTFNVLEGLREAERAGVVDTDRFRGLEARALDFMLEHKLYRSDKTGEVVDERFTELSYPAYWHYNYLRALDYISRTPFIKDSRLEDPLSLLETRRKKNGLWPVEKRIPGVTLFDMEKMGGDSRWNTLRALKVLKAAGRLS